MTNVKEFLTNAGFDEAFMEDALNSIAIPGEDDKEVFLPYDQLIDLFEPDRVDHGLPPFRRFLEAAE
jgi:hypothetical protein